LYRGCAALATYNRPVTVLFTGFPGFIGERLLGRLLALTAETSYVCLVQERFLPQAQAALERMDAAGRVRLEMGDITKPGLGLEAARARSLARELTGGFHLAAAYDLAVRREVGFRVNVEGTRNVLRFLSDCPVLRRLHYVSTAYVSGRAVGLFRETDLDVGQSFKNAYEETKFLAEVEVARSGIPATIYRPSVVVGDSRTGETAKFDGPYFVLSAMERVPSPGLFMRVGWGRTPVNVVPVDFVVEAMARLATAPAAADGVYHLTDPTPPTLLQVARLLAASLGRKFVFVPVPPWPAPPAPTPRAVQRYLGLPVETVEYYNYPCLHDTTAATRALAPLGIVCPRLESYVDVLVRFWRERKAEIRRGAMV
jgi:thioester reductase-like protein